ncbi:hypothetical protein C4559_03860 [Candidatus Microgenomates bacterium]|nr:MAG: hypothetical protein C4559_03860 [Candidatus Microgenomates bacterium]
MDNSAQDPTTPPITENSSATPPQPPVESLSQPAVETAPTQVPPPNPANPETSSANPIAQPGIPSNPDFVMSSPPKPSFNSGESANPPSQPPVNPTQPNMTPEHKGRNPFVLLFIIILFLFAVGAAAYFLLPIFNINLPFLAAKKQNIAKVCTQVITPAKNIKTGTCKEYPTSCDVPMGWIKVSSCTPTPTPNPTANWKTYMNTKYGYTIQYPLDVQVNENTIKNNVEFKKIEESDNNQINKGYVVSVTYIPIVNLDNYVKEQYKNSKTACNSTAVVSNVLDTTFTGINAKQYSVKNCLSSGNNTQLYLIKDKFLISISRNELGDLESQNSNAVFTDQILSTFKFISASDSAVPDSSTSAKTATNSGE